MEKGKNGRELSAQKQFLLCSGAASKASYIHWKYSTVQLMTAKQIKFDI